METSTGGPFSQEHEGGGEIAHSNVGNVTQFFACRKVLLSCLSDAQRDAVRAESVEEFYSKNKLNIIVGVPPGGSYDLNARLVGRLLQNICRATQAPSIKHAWRQYDAGGELHP